MNPANELRAAVRQIVHRELGFDLSAHVARSAEVIAFDLTRHVKRRQNIEMVASTCAKLRRQRQAELEYGVRVDALGREVPVDGGKL
jgi:hypothetical protein